MRLWLRPEDSLSQAYAIFRFGHLVGRKSRSRNTDRSRLQDREAVTRRLRRRRATGVHQAHSVLSGFTIAALDALRSSIGLRAVADSVVRLVAAETVTGFLIRAVAGVTQVHRFSRYPRYNLGIRLSRRRCSGRRIALYNRRRSCNYVRSRSRLSFTELVLTVAVI